MAACRTKKSGALAVTLKKLYSEGMDPAQPRDIRESIEEYGHRMLISERIERLQRAEGHGLHGCGAGKGRFEFALTFIAIVAVNYFVV
jgi:hypothetical protein